jgi:hypothetical protein
MSFQVTNPSALELHRPGLAVAVAAGRRMPNLRADVGRAGAADAVAVADEDTTRWEEQEGQVVDRNQRLFCAQRNDDIRYVSKQ